MPILYNRIINNELESAISLAHYIETDISTGSKTKKTLLLDLSNLIDATIRGDIITDAVDIAVDDALNDLAGSGVIWWGTDDPAVSGKRILLLTGQTILIANYPEVDESVYVGDGNNATASAFYRTSDTPGTVRNIAGPYLVLSDSRGYALRGLDIAAAVDPDGASRDVGSIQLDATQLAQGTMPGIYSPGGITSGVFSKNTIAGNRATGAQTVTDYTFDNSLTLRTAIEDRMINIACNIGIRY